MEYTVAQVAADPDSVADALATVAPTWLARTGMAQSQGWTSVRMDRRPAVRAAPLLQVAAGLGLAAILMLLIRGPWIGIPIVVAVILVLQLIRYLLGRSLD